MKVTQYRHKTGYRSGSGSMLTDPCSGAFVDEVKRSALLIVVLSVIVVLATGCSTTGTGSNATLTSLISTTPQDENSEKNDGGYQPARSPAFSDLFGS
jgi:hypothetical protein